MSSLESQNEVASVLAGAAMNDTLSGLLGYLMALCGRLFSQVESHILKDVSLQFFPAPSLAGPLACADRRPAENMDKWVNRFTPLPASSRGPDVPFLLTAPEPSV